MLRLKVLLERGIFPNSMAPKNPESGPLNRLSDLARRAGINQPEVVIEKAPPTDLDRAQEALRNAAVSNDGPTIQDEAEKVRVSLGGKPKGARDAARRKRGTPKKESDFKDGPKPKFLGIKPKKLKKRLQTEEQSTVSPDDAQPVPEEPVKLSDAEKARIADILREFEADAGVPTDPTLRETKQGLEEAVASEKARLEESAAPEEPPQTKKKETGPDPIAAVRSRLNSRNKTNGPVDAEFVPIDMANRRYEARAEGVATRTGLTDRFNEVRSTRQAYLEARALAHQRGYAQDDIGDLKQAYDRALFGWKQDLEGKTEGITRLKAKVEKENASRKKKNLPPIIGAGLSESEKNEYRNKSEAAVIAKRDTILGPANVELEARRLALNENGKTALGKAEIWLSKAPQVLLNLPFEVIGKGAALAFHKSARGNSKDIKAVREKYARQYARGARILAGAGFATAIALAASPVAATTGLLTFGVYAARGAIGTIAGVGAAKATGSIIDRFFAPKRKSELRDWLAKPATTLEEYQEQQAAYKRNNTRQRSNERMGWQMVAAVLTGAGVGLATSPVTRIALDQIGALKSVGEAAQTVADTNAHTPGVPSTSHLAHGTDPVVPAAAAPVSHEGAPLNTGTEAAPVHPTAPSTSVLEVSTKPGEGFGQLLVDLRHQVGTLEHASPELKHFLEQNPNALTHALGAAHDGQSLTLQPGDKLVVDSDQHVWYQAVGKDPQLVFEHTAPTAEAPDGYVIKHIDGHMQPDLRHHVPVQETPSHSPEVAAAPVEDPSAALNRAQAGGTSILSPETFLDGSDLNTLTQPSDLDSTIPSEPAALVPEQVPPSTPVPEQATVTPPAPEQLPPATPEAPVQSALEPFVNSNGAEVAPAIARVYPLPDGRLVVWGEVPYQTQIDAAKVFIAEQRELGKHVSILIERSRMNVFTGQMETTMYEYSTDTEDTKVYSPGSLPIKPFGPNDFVRPQ